MTQVHPAQRFRLSHSAIHLAIGVLFLFSVLPTFIPSSSAQSITSSGLNTVVTPSGNTYNITGGTRPNGGTNLFHSFGEFNVPTNNIANFLNETALPTNNILGRVTGGNPSSIFGTIQTEGFGSANLFLINPAGIIFGPTATLNVGGMATFTTADYLKLGDGVVFNAVPNVAADALLSTAPVAAFGFLGTNPASITVQGSQLTVAEGAGISLVGGDITVEGSSLDGETIQPAKLLAPGGQINVASVGGPGEISAADYLPSPGMAMGSISLSQGTLLDASGDAAGTIRIRGGQFIISDATLSADTVDSNGAQVGVDINVSGTLSISDTRGIPSITARTTGIGDAGAILIQSGNMTASSTFLDASFAPTFIIDSHTNSTGRAGDVAITTGTLDVRGLTEPRSTSVTFIESGTRGSGRGGDVTIAAEHIDLDWMTISTGDFIARQSFLSPSGSAGNLTITADTLRSSNIIFVTEAFAALDPSQTGGDLTLNVRDIAFKDSQIGAGGIARGGAITFANFDRLFTDFTFFETLTLMGPGGGITASGRSIELTNGSKLVATTLGDGDAGSIRLTASDHITLSGQTSDNPSIFSQFSPTGLFSNSFGDLGLGNLGASGDIVVTTPRLVMDTGGRINAITNSSGRGGNVTINADSVSISGEFTSPSYFVEGTIIDIGDYRPSGIFTRTVGNAESCAAICGNGGDITLNVGSLTMGPGAQIDSGTSSSGPSGTIAINAGNTVSLSGTLSDGSPVGIFSRTTGADADAGAGGNISLTAGQSVTISDGAAVSASSTGPADAGNISLNAGQQLVMQNASITTEATQASGGNINIQAVELVGLESSTISASVEGGPTTSGGNITIDPNYVILQNSQILANATQGAGGNISITTNVFLPDSTSVVSASSQFGVNGNVTIQSPISQGAGQLSPLPKNPLVNAALLTQRCAAIAQGEVSSFTVAGRETLPVEPGGWLTSPLAELSGEEGPMVRSDHLGPFGDDQARLSLRRLPSQSALAQLYPGDWFSGCGS